MMRIALGLSAAMLGLVAEGAAAQVPREVVGVWGRTARDCQLRNDAVVTIERDRIRFYEGSCRIRSARRDGAVILLTSTCTFEGQTTQGTERLTLSGANRFAAQWSGWTSGSYQRCGR